MMGYTVFVAFGMFVFHARVGYTKPARKEALNRIPQVTNGMIVEHEEIAKPENLEIP